MSRISGLRNPGTDRFQVVGWVKAQIALGFAGTGEPIQRFNRIETYAQRNPAIIGETQPTIFKMSGWPKLEPIPEYRWRGFGRMKKSRISIAKAFVAKSVYNFETNDILIEYLNGCKNLRRLCGWERSGQIPSRATFSRAFAEFAENNLPQKIHEAMVKKHCGPKIAGHISRDFTAIESREKPAKTLEPAA